jgi:SpoIID/LytB domain protein
MRPPRASARRSAGPVSGALGAALLLVGSVGALSLGSAAPAGAATEFVNMTATTSVKVLWRGNGHGHGMSQYGAQGAAQQGLSTAQILAFYYPHTTLTKIAASTVRVLISGGTADTTVYADGGLTVTGYGTLPAGYTRFRLVPSGSGLAAQGLKGTSWHTLKRGLPARADFRTTSGSVQLALVGGSSTRYRGTVGAVRSGSGELTINRVSLDGYTEGVAPREMPASWDIDAVRAQAIAARTYARSLMDAAGGGGSYDICDTTSCQVYGGMTHYDSAGNVAWRDDPAAVGGNANTVLTYQGAAIFAQYSASNGGATVDGGKPYLVGKSDPYDTAASGDPYLDESEQVQVAALNNRFGLKSISSIQVTKRDGHGPWGGRIVTATVNGTTKSGAAAHIQTTGFGLGGAVGLGTDYLRFQAGAATATAPTAVTAVPRNAVAKLSWKPPASSGGTAITGYRIAWPGHAQSLPATARSAWVGPISNLATTSITVRAVTARGAGQVSTVRTRAVAAPAALVPVAPRRLFDTGSTLVDPRHPYRFAVPGHGSVPASGATSVQLSVTVEHPSTAGVLTVAPSGVDARPVAALAYRAHRVSTATVSVPLTPSGTVVFTPSSGQVRVWADQESYTAASGSRLVTAARRTIATVPNVATGAGTAVSLNGLPGISAASTGVLVGVDASSAASTWLRLWADGAAPRSIQHVAVTPYAASANTVLLPLGRSHVLHVLAGRAGVRARLTLLGVLGSAGGRLETFPPSPIVDDTVSRKSVSVGTTAVPVAVLGGAQIPKTGARAMLLRVTVAAAGRTGQLWVYPTEAQPPAAPSVRFAGTGPATATTLVRIGAGSGVQLKSSVPGVKVSVDAIGYVSSS